MYRKKRKIKLIAGIILLIVIIPALFDMAGVGGGKNPIDIKVEEGMGLSAIAERLDKAGVINSEFAFKVYARLTGKHVYQMGIHNFNASMSYRQIVKELEKMPEADTYTVLIPEGYELRQIADVLDEKGLINKEVFLREASNGSFENSYGFVADIPDRDNRLEGYLYPDTYTFSNDMTEREIISVMLDNFEKKVIPVYESAHIDRSLDEIINLASVIEREAANDEERGKVASVFINRLSKGMRLESCATVQYILKERKAVLSNEDTMIDSPYNTYRNSGLPYGPIAAPGIKSIEAALYPEDTEYFYFLATADGSESIFARTFEEHIQNQNRVQ